MSETPSTAIEARLRETVGGRAPSFIELEAAAEIASLRAQLDAAKAALSDIAGASWGQASNGQPMTHKRLTIDRAEKALRALLSESKT